MDIKRLTMSSLFRDVIIYLLCSEFTIEWYCYMLQYKGTPRIKPMF
jgi:hypothetical protein